MKKIILAAIGGTMMLSLLSTQDVSAQFAGAQGTPVSSVADVLKVGTDDQRVILRGNILRRLYGDKYIFSDGTAEIRVDIDADEWPAGQPVNEKTMVEIIGKIDTDWGRVSEIDVKVLRVVK